MSPGVGTYDGVDPVELSIDVSHVCGERAELRGTWFPGSPTRSVLVCMPGGSYNRRYFDLQVPGLTGYSFSEDLRARGYGVVAFDNLGTGSSSILTGDIDLHDQATAMGAAMQALPAAIGHDGPFVGVGHSMGGQIAIIRQSEVTTFDALAILGTTTMWVAPLGLSAEAVDAARTDRGRSDFVQRLLTAMPDPFLAPDRADMAAWFHLDDVPPQVVAEDERQTLTVVPRRCAAQGSAPFVLLDPAGRIDVPVLLAYGSVDVSPDPGQEVASFSSSPDITLVRIDRSGHCHNMASTRTILWNRIAAWLDALPW